jgi:hypothetical protein
LNLGSCATGGGLPGTGVIWPAEFQPFPLAIKSGTLLASAAAQAIPAQSTVVNMLPASKAVLNLDIALSLKSVAQRILESQNNRSRRSSRSPDRGFVCPKETTSGVSHEFNDPRGQAHLPVWVAFE